MSDVANDRAARRSTATPLRFVDLDKAFGHVKVLRNVSLDIPGGQTTCVIGPSGSGKSTLLRCTNLLERPEGGAIYLGDQCVTAEGTEVDLVRARVGIVFQHFHLFPHLSVLDNVTLALRKVKKMPAAAAEQIAVARLAEVGLGGLERRRPATLSGGQQQRVAICRALAMDPEVMLFDEATSALDPELVKGVLDVMRGLSESGMTLLIVTHEMRFAREVADQMVFMDAGRIVEVATPDTFFDSPRSARLREFLSQVL